jgi:23S rRNA (guanosine2251-2'-O)-methyltransferase
MSRFVVGRNAVTEALQAGENIESVLVLFGAKGFGLEKIKDIAKQKSVPVKEVSKQRIRELVGNVTTQGIMAVLGEKEYVQMEQFIEIAKTRNEQPFIVVCDEVEDPHNLGAITRTSEACGVHGIVIPKHRSVQVNATVTKASAGATEHLPFTRVSNTGTAIDELKKKGVWIVGTDSKASKNYTEIDYNMPVAIVVGNEGKGLRRLIKEKSDFLVKIPMFGKISSLNVSVATALLLYEVVRKRKGF